MFIHFCHKSLQDRWQQPRILNYKLFINYKLASFQHFLQWLIQIDINVSNPHKFLSGSGFRIRISFYADPDSGSQKFLYAYGSGSWRVTYKVHIILGKKLQQNQNILHRDAEPPDFWSGSGSEFLFCVQRLRIRLRLLTGSSSTGKISNLGLNLIRQHNFNYFFQLI